MALLVRATCRAPVVVQVARASRAMTLKGRAIGQSLGRLV